MKKFLFALLIVCTVSTLAVATMEYPADYKLATSCCRSTCDRSGDCPLAGVCDRSKCGDCFDDCPICCCCKTDASECCKTATASCCSSGTSCCSK